MRKTQGLSVLTASVALILATSASRADLISYNFDNGYPWVPLGPVGTGGVTTAEGFSFSSSGPPLTLRPTTSVGEAGNLLTGNYSPGHRLLGSPSPSVLSMDFSLSSVGPVSKVSFWAAQSGTTATSLRVLLNGAIPINFQLQAYGDPALGQVPSATTFLDARINSTDWNVPSITSLTAQFQNSSGSATTSGSIGFDNFRFQVAGNRSNDSALKLAPAGMFPTPNFRALLAPPGTILYNYVRVERTAGTSPADFEVSYLGSSKIRLDPQYPIPSRGHLDEIASFYPGQNSLVSIQLTPDSLGTHNGTFYLRNLSNPSDMPMGLGYSLTVYEPPELQANNLGVLDTTNGPATINVLNTAGNSGQRAPATPNSIQVIGPFTVSDVPVYQPLNGGSTLTGTVSFNDDNALNGTYSGSVTLYFGLDEVLSPTPWYESRTWSVSRTVTGHTGNGTATLQPGTSLTGINTTSASGGSTGVQLLDGMLSAESTLEVTFQSGDGFVIGGGTPVGDVVSFTGTGDDTFVLQMTFSANDLATAGLAPGSAVNLFWLNPVTNTWTLAVNGNAGGTPSSFNSPYSASLFSLGNYGYFYNPDGSGGAWAVINHNSLFGIGNATVGIPEPSTTAFVLAGSAIGLRRRRSSQARDTLVCCP